ncbi:hypothetical protein MF271_13690 [Deinococcus sp. KNUC1210]|uniref:hypothetical protein n=1 Tax=Deinococcus sp. KNUC1210 TaxID=2917691 RepID=UPI001EF0145B|nr:hypothetical protein [Deinococcus sp. KNUC1210]ULH15003.1 hypothetical protein MF271_13690 [Deinococcus sp. KNUC1210]
MKKFLVLIPLLSACAPTFTGTNNPTPFKTGQSWRLSSKSALDSQMAPSTTFTITDVASDDGDWSVHGVTSSKSDVSIHYNDETPKTSLIYDYSNVDADGSRARICMIAMKDGASVNSGYAAHIPVTKLFKSSDASDTAFKDALKKAFDKNSDDTTIGFSTLYTKSIAQALDDSDNAPCTLELLK